MSDKQQQFWEERKEQLTAPLDMARVKEREQSGFHLKYIEAWDAIDKANQIFGFGAWQRELLRLNCVTESEYKHQKSDNMYWAVSYIATVRITVDGIVRDGTGSGHGFDKQRGLAHESAVKEAESDAMKRAMSTYGNQFGLALYDKSMSNVVYNGASKTTDKPAAKPKAKITSETEYSDLSWTDKKEHMKSILEQYALAAGVPESDMRAKYFTRKSDGYVTTPERMLLLQEKESFHTWFNDKFAQIEADMKTDGFEYSLKDSTASEIITDKDIPF